jgi:hypothetical protein
MHEGDLNDHERERGLSNGTLLVSWTVSQVFSKLLKMYEKKGKEGVQVFKCRRKLTLTD